MFKFVPQFVKMKKDTTTEEKIKEAARQVFLSKGFSGCSSREIAKAAGMNVALVNYYFRSKGQLFELIFRAAMEDFMLSMVQVFGTDQTLVDKLRIFIDREYDFLSKHPELPNFVISEMNREEGCSVDHSFLMHKIAETGIFNELMIAQKEGKMREMSLISITLLIMSNCQYPVMAKNLMQNIHGLSDAEYADHLLLHKRYVTEMLIEFLFPKK